MPDPAEPLLDVFPGLRPFEPEETHLFFGRDGQSDEIIKRLAVHRFLAVVGTSGSGKSSLVRAGLLPSLRGGFMSGAGSTWLIALFRPGLSPITSLAAAVNESVMQGRGQFDSETQLILLETTLRRSSFGLVEAARQAAMEPHENLLVLVDQFEEVFRLKNTRKSFSGDDDEAAAFVKLLLEAARQTEIPIYVVITMRSDFIGDCAEYRGLPEMLNDGQYLVPRMTREQRRQAIEGPIAVGHATITPRLVQRLLNDVGDDPDHLPILQHALMRTWGAWRKQHAPEQPIDLPHYEGIGGMANALSQHADEAFSELDEAGRQIAHRMFKRLSEKGTDGREISRPTKLSEICAVTEASEPEVTAVIDKFRTGGRTFLTPSSRSPLSADSLIDISHESLIRLWVRLRNWTQAEAESAALYRRLADVSARHAAGVASLWRDPELQLALDWQARNHPNEAWATRYGGDFSTAIHFLDFSRDERDRVRQIRRAVFVGSITLAIVFAVLGLFSLRELQEARRLNNLALSRGLASQAELILNESPDQVQLASLLAVEGARHGGLVQANRALYDTMRLLPITRLRFSQTKDGKLSPMPTALSADGRFLVRVSGGALQIVDTRSGAERMRFNDQDSARAVALSPDGQFLVVGEPAKTTVFNVASAKKTWSHTTLDPIVVSVSANARFVAMASETHVEVYNLEDGSSTLTLPKKDEAPVGIQTFTQPAQGSPQIGTHRLSKSAERGYKAIAFSADGNLFAAAGGPNVDSAVYDLRTGTKAYELGGGGHLGAVVFSRGRGYLAAAGDDVKLFDQTSGSVKNRFGLDRSASGVAISPDGRYVAVATDETIPVFEVASSKRVADLPAPEPVDNLVFGPQGRNLLVDTPSGLRVFEQLAARQFKFADEPAPGTTSLSPGGRFLALAFIERAHGNAVYRRYDVASGKELVPSLPVSTDLLGGLAVSGDGRFLATLPNSFGAVPIFDVTTGKPQSDSLVSGAYAAIALSNDGLSVAVARDPHGRNRDAATEILVAKRMDPTFVHPWVSDFAVKSLAFSPDADYLAAGGKDSIALYNVVSHRKISEIHSSSDVKSVAATDEGKYVMAVGSRFSIYNSKNGEEVFSETAPNGDDQSIALSAEGKHTVVASTNQTDTVIAEFPGDISKVIEDACSRLDRNLTLVEWNRYLGGEPYHKTCKELP